MDIYTYLQETDAEKFIRLKRRKFAGWEFLISGEWF